MPDPVKVTDEVAKGASAVADATKAAKEAEPTKPLIKSKTFWFNVAAFGLTYAQYLPAKTAAVVVPIANILLRLLTTSPASLK